MRREAIAWERAAEVDAAARGWRRVGAIDEATLRRIREAYPDPCVTPSAVWRVLTGGMVVAIVLCTFFAVSIAFGQRAGLLRILLLLFAGACLVVTDVLEAFPRSARRGAAGATALLGVGFFLVGLGLVLVENVKLYDNEAIDQAIDVLLVAGVLACGLAGWRWGSPVFAGLSGIALFGYLGRLPYGRALWLLAGAVLTGVAVRHLDDGRLAPSHRIAAAVLTVIGIGAVYTAANVYSLDERLIEQIAAHIPSREALPRGGFLAATLATALLPLALLAWGVRSRRTVILDTGIILLALSLVTLRHYVHVAPLWVALALSGALLIALALAVERALRRARAGEVAGFTADPLFSDERRQQMLQVVPVVTAFTPTPTSDPGFAAEGGRFGGGGAQEKF